MAHPDWPELTIAEAWESKQPQFMLNPKPFVALRFGRAFGQSPQYWLNLPAGYDLKSAERVPGKLLAQVRPLAA